MRLVGSQAVLVDTNHHGIVDGIFRGDRQHGAFRAGLEVHGHLFPGPEHAGGFHHRIHAQFRPGQLPGVAFVDHASTAARRYQLAVFDGDPALETAHDRVVPEQVGQRIVIEQIVDRHHIDLVGGLGDAKYGAADAAEPVNGDAHQAASRVVEVSSPA